MKKILILNGPNLNMLGTRQPEIYGDITIKDIEKMCRDEAQKLNVAIDFRQSNSEEEIISDIQQAKAEFDGIIINAAAYTHTSVAILDALYLFEKPIIEVHISNIYKREEFRHKSFISSAADGVLCGFGADGYLIALNHIVKL